MTSLDLIAPIGDLPGNIPPMAQLPDFNPGKLLCGDNIRRARKAKKMTKLALAQACGVSERAVYNWEHDIHIPEGEARDKLLEVLDLELPDGLTGRGGAMKVRTDPAQRHELEMIRQHVRMIGMLLDQMLGDSKNGHKP